MNIEEKYHGYWCLNLDSALTEDQLNSLEKYLNDNPHKQAEWEEFEKQIKVLKTEDIVVSDNFEFDVLTKIKTQGEQLFDKVSMMILSTGIAAALLLMINLFINQDVMSIDAMFGIADMNADNTGLLFYID
jgi:hypothetical protein